MIYLFCHVRECVGGVHSCGSDLFIFRFRYVATSHTLLYWECF
jgi:hypothetical protein